MSADPHEESPDHSLSIEEAAARLNVSPVTIRRRIKTGEIGAFNAPQPTALSGASCLMVTAQQ
jgi:hypothetical protein